MLTALIVITGLLTTAGCAGLYRLGRRYVTTAKRAIASDAAEIRPGLVSFVLADCAPGTSAYDATILDLAARGYLGVASQPPGIWLTYTEADAQAATSARLASYEQLVLDAMHGRLRNTGGAPFAVLAQTYRVDVEGTWKPFEEALRKEARRRGICRAGLPLSPAIVTVAAATYVAAVVFTVLLSLAFSHTARTGPVDTGLGTALALPLLLAGAGWRDRLTPLGASIAAYWRAEREALAGSPATWGFGPAIGAGAGAGGLAGPAGWADGGPAALQRRAFAAGADIPGAAGGLVSTGRARARRRGSRKPTAEAPTEAWSSFTGTWLLVRIKDMSNIGMGRGVVLLAMAAWIGLIAYALDLAGVIEPTPALAGLVAVGFGVGGLLEFVRVSGLPRWAAFDGQVIACWNETDDSENGSGKVAHCAVDNGVRSWVFSGPAVSQVALEDLVRVTVNPRSDTLIELVVTSHQRPPNHARTV